MTSALSGSTTEPVITKRTSSVVTTTSASASGRCVGQARLLVGEAGRAAADLNREWRGQRTDLAHEPLCVAGEIVGGRGDIELPDVG